MFRIVDLGRTDYREGLRVQESMVRHVGAGDAPETLVLAEYSPVITLGKTADARNVLWSRDALAADGIDLVATDRGGDVTYHGPGQLVGYPILDLRRRGKDLGAYVRRLEDVLIGTVAAFGIEAARWPGRTGVWVGDRKIAAIGIHVSRWITSHGFALNVEPDLAHFGAIVPCGIRDAGVTSIVECAAIRPTVAAAREAFVAAFRRAFAFTEAPEVPAS